MRMVIKVGTSLIAPGGRIDTFTWSWTWLNNAHEPGGAAFKDRYVLRRQRGEATKFGYLGGTSPLPGLDGWGRLCLHLTGVLVDPVTGHADFEVDHMKFEQHR